MTEEEWRPVPDSPDYQISDLGRVISLRKWRGQPGPRFLRPGLAGNGYFTVVLAGPRGRGSRCIHHLVAEAFIGPRPKGMEVRHLDGDKQNNKPDNLAYGTSSDNNYDQVRHGTHPWAGVTHCIHGHRYDESNTYKRPDGYRACRACGIRRARESKQRQMLRAAGIAA